MIINFTLAWVKTFIKNSSSNFPLIPLKFKVPIKVGEATRVLRKLSLGRETQNCLRAQFRSTPVHVFRKSMVSVARFWQGKMTCFNDFFRVESTKEKLKWQATNYLNIYFFVNEVRSYTLLVSLRCGYKRKFYKCTFMFSLEVFNSFKTKQNLILLKMSRCLSKISYFPIFLRCLCKVIIKIRKTTRDLRKLSLEGEMRNWLRVQFGSTPIDIFQIRKPIVSRRRFA